MNMPAMSERRAWGLLTAGAGIAAGALARWVLTRGWRASTGREPPDGTRDADGARVVVWAAATAATVAAARILAHRGARRLWTDGLGRELPDEA